MPVTARYDGRLLFDDSEAFLEDNRGRRAMVTGAGAEVTSETIKSGPVRAVIRREGWYVADDGARLARARVWLYFTAGSPYLRITHSLVLTEDTNEVWFRDYGLFFRSPAAPREVAFALDNSNRDPGELLAGRPVAAADMVRYPFSGNEIFLLQDDYPHYLERAALAVVGRGAGRHSSGGATTNIFWEKDWLAQTVAAGDWGDAAYQDHGLTVVMPWLAQRFPKEIAFSSEGVRLAFWSGRSGRELDFRAATLVADYWGQWSSRASGGANALSQVPSNAQGGARTHDVWLLPRQVNDTPAKVMQRAQAASQPPLVLADPAWLTASEAIGWPMHPLDMERFPREETVLSDFWDSLMASHERLPRTGFIAWGAPPYIRGPGGFFRVSALVDYGLRRHAWGLLARSGDRRYYDYAHAFNRYAGDWALAHWTAGKKYKGGFTNDRGHWDYPREWGSFTQIVPVGGNTGHDIVNWLLEYYLTGDEYVLELTRMHGEAFKQNWEETSQSLSSYDGIFMVLRVLANLYAREWDEDFGEMARELARYVIDMDSPNAINDDIRFGSLYKVDRNLISIYYYYRETGDELARQAFLKCLDYEYRFNRVGGAFGGQSYPSLLFSVGYRWTGDVNYLRVINALLDQHRRWGGSAGITSQINPTMGLPAALGAMADVSTPPTPFPVLRQYAQPDPSRIMLRLPAEGSSEMRIHLRMSNQLAEDTLVTVLLAPHVPGGSEAAERLRLREEAMFRTSYTSRSDPRRRNVALALPTDVPPGLYTLEFPGADYVDVLDTDVPEISVYAPEGFRMQGAAVVDYFRVDEGLEQLRLSLGVPTEIRRPDGSVALEATADNIGEIEIPVEGLAGIWSMRPNQSGIVRLLNAEPLFARSPGWLVTGAQVQPKPRFQPPTEDMAFVPGLRGQALHLPGAKTLTFQRGDPDGGKFTQYPGDTGTVEFWFRPNWSSTELPFSVGRSFNDLNFLRSGSQTLQYRRGRERSRSPEFASMNLWVFGKDTNAGFTGRFWLEAGEWYHLAFTWQTVEGEPGTAGHYAVYVNGEPLRPDPARPPGQDGTIHYWPGRVNAALPFFRREPDARIAVTVGLHPALYKVLEPGCPHPGTVIRCWSRGALTPEQFIRRWSRGALTPEYQLCSSRHDWLDKNN
ncbi:MAG: LamG domain-containing protein [Lentisphaerae bacterium]|nr:LamG domain-containing protein [Lentisphaerota bacterium]